MCWDYPFDLTIVIELDGVMDAQLHNNNHNDKKYWSATGRDSTKKH